MRNYCKIAACFIFVAGIVGISASTIFAYSGGPPEGRTGSPADEFKTCDDTGCHNSYILNSGLATFSLSAPSSYTLGEALSISISFGSSSTSKHGFELSALDTNNNHVGTFSSVDSNTQTIDGNYIKHNSAGSIQSGNASWSVQWTAPASAVQDPLTFYAAGNEANGNGTPTGDYIYATTAQVSSAAATPAPSPTALPTLPPLPSPGASPTLPPPPPTLPPLPSPVTSPTPSECEPKFISTDTKKLKLKFGENKTVTVTVSGDDCKSDGATVTAAVKTGKNRVTIDTTTATTDANGQATFTITARQKNGNSKVVFTVEDSEGKVSKTFVIVKIRKK
ncbi:MAG: choice-of-anchor V domain-containing protein [Candidatus Brocadiaceae bacterium]|nr:choice-of-anchor V domain-containing protein [Candidatus Brocadiaceae bacterium]